MCTNDATASIHKVFHTACYSHFFCRGLFCLNNSVVDLIVPFDFNQLIGAINHLRKEGTPRDEAVNNVLRSVPKEDVLYTIIHQEYDAVVKMLGYEYTLEDFKQNNYEKGREEGREEGIEEGELRKQTATIIRMLENHETMEKIICYSEADEETIRKIAKENGLTIHE